MNTILIPLDGSELAESALEPGLRLAKRRGTGVILVSVVSQLPPVPLASSGRDSVARWLESEQERATEYLARAKEKAASLAPEVDVDTRVEVGPVARSLMDVASAAGVDLIVLTTHGRGAWQRTWLGSVADNLVRGARRPLLLLREGDASADLFRAESSPAHVVVPLDESAEAEQILAPLAPVVEGTGGRVTLLTVIGDPFPLSSSYLPHAIEETALAEQHRERAEQHLGEVASRWQPPGVTVDHAVIAGEDAARAVLEYAEAHEADLLALSTRGRGGVGRLILGSVADKLVRGARLPVLAVRRAPDGTSD